MDTIRFVDTTIRDGHQSLWAENMTTGMMLPIAKNLDDAGFEGIELISGSHLKKTVRELKEDPWERVRLISKIITKTPLRLIAGRVNTFEYNPPSMYRLFVERMFANGIREARISDEWNDYEGWKFRVGECHRAGMKSILNLIYSVSPKHSDEYFAVTHAPSRIAQALSAVPQRSGRITHAGADGNSGADYFQERRRHPRGVAHALHHRIGSALLHQRHGARDSLHQYGIAAARGRHLQPIALQRCQKRPRVGLQNRYR